MDAISIRKEFVRRRVDPLVHEQARRLGLTDLQSRIVAGRISRRGDALPGVVSPSLQFLSHPDLLKDCGRASGRIAEAIADRRPIAVVTDYDVDGICSHALIVEALLLFGHPRQKINGHIGHRLKDGYGLSGNVADQIMASGVKPDIVITADCGISDQERIDRLSRAGIDVIVTDHHAVPREGIPESAFAVVNPTRDDCPYPDKSISGCMVSWLLMCQVRNTLIKRNSIAGDTPKLGCLLDYVALSTVADAVSLLSPSNRAVVARGLAEINSFSKPAWRVLAGACRSDNFTPCQFTAEDLGYQIGPRINAQGRVADAGIAVQFFLSRNDDEAGSILKILDQSNSQRKDIEKDMVEKANFLAETLIREKRKSLVISDSAFHPGVQGIVASRLVDTYGVPAIVLSPVANTSLHTGSARTTPSIHIRDMLQEIDNRYPGVIAAFGGHKGAAGVKVEDNNVSRFVQAFEEVLAEHLQDDDLKLTILTDGELDDEALVLETVNELRAMEPFGTEFETPMFEGIFQVKEIRMLGKVPVHAMMTIARGTNRYKAIWFRALDTPGEDIQFNIEDTIRCAYKLKLNIYRGRSDLQLVVEHAERDR